MSTERDELAAARLKLAWLMWCYRQGYTSPTDRVGMRSHMADDARLLHPNDVIERDHLLAMADEILASLSSAQLAGVRAQHVEGFHLGDAVSQLETAALLAESGGNPQASGLWLAIELLHELNDYSEHEWLQKHDSGVRAQDAADEDGEICQDCERHYSRTLWHADDMLWADLVDDTHGGTLCPGCFSDRALRHGVVLRWRPEMFIRKGVGHLVPSAIEPRAEQEGMPS